MEIEQHISQDTLRGLPLFSELKKEQLREVISISKILQLKKNESVFSEGDHYKGFFILLKGLVKVFKFSSTGKESVLHLIKPFETFGDVPLFESGDYPVNAQAMSDSVIVLFPKTEFLKLLSENSDICIKMLAGFAKKMRALTKKVEDFSTKEILNRLAGYIIEEIKRSNTQNLTEPFIKLAVSKKNIASFLGTITETLSRTLKKLEEDQIIRQSGKTIFIKNLKRLKDLAK